MPHHDKADVGAFTNEQLRALKAAGGPGAEVAGRFDWLRRDLILRIGSNFYFDTPVVLTYQQFPLIWFTQDEQEHRLVNIRMMSRSGEPRWVMQDSCWMLGGSPADVECPPSGRLLDVKYPNGDHARVEFRTIENCEEGRRTFQNTGLSRTLTTILLPHVTFVIVLLVRLSTLVRTNSTPGRQRYEIASSETVVRYP